MRIVVTGAGGMLGRDVVASAHAGGHEPLAFARSELDVTDADAVRESIANARPDVVVNCAAWTDVDGAEADEAGATAVNGHGAGYVAAAAGEVGAPVIYPSTDYVFDGHKREPYLESDPVDPRSAYGRSKLAGERATAAATTAHHVVRTAWLFGLAGKNFVDTMLRLGRERDTVSVVDDQVGSPTFTGHLARALVALAGSTRYGLHHAAAAGECSWFEFARAIFDRARVDCRVEPTTSAELSRPASRPAYSVLRSERGDAIELPPWRAGLDAYLALRATEVAA
jgi:dTDP-4-dehydrorhamnose reductase